MIVPFQVDVPMERWPFANWVLIAVTSVVGIVFVGGSFLGAGELTERERVQLIERVQRENPHADDGELDRRIDEAVARAETLPGALVPGYWTFLQLFTSLFVHGDILHLVGNMLFLFVFGNAVNAKLGHLQFLAAYFLIGALSGLAWLLLGTGQPLVGASGAIMGLLGLFAVLYPRNDVTVLYWISLSYAGEFSISSYWLILFYFVGDLFGTLLQHVSGVAYICHVVGALAGALLGGSLLLAGFYAPARGEENLLQFLGVLPKEAARKKKKKRKRVRHDEEGR